MASYNKVILMGNLTRDPELRYTPKGTAVATIRLAVNRRWRSETGEEREEVTFVDVEAFARQAEVLSQYLKKGNPIFIEGRLRLDQWEDKNTHQKRSQLRVVLESFNFIGPTNRTDNPQGQPAGNNHQAPGNVSRSPQNHHQPPPQQPAPAALPPGVPDMEPPPPEASEDDVPF